MEELQAPKKYMDVLKRIYESLVCQVHMREGIYEIFSSDVGMKRHLSPTLFGLCIDQLECMVQVYVDYEWIEEVTIMWMT